MLSNEKKIELLAHISTDINRIKDLDFLLEKILTSARKIFNADAGSIYLRKNNHLNFSYTQNDTLQTKLQPGKKLIYNTFSMPINNNSIAGYVANNNKILNIPDIHNINKTEPYTFNPSFDKASNYKTISMLTAPLTNQEHKIIGVIQIINPKNNDNNVIPFSTTDENIIQLFANSVTLALERAQMTRDIILRTIKVAELRDPQETGAHVNRVAAYSVEIYEQWARKKGIKEGEIERTKDIFRLAAMLHDVGKVAISDIILKKPGKLNQEEFKIMQDHTVAGSKLFKNIASDLDKMAQDIALNHHEKWDGTGYPGHIDKLTGCALPHHCDQNGNPKPKKGEEIPILARIVAVADVYDALSSKRVYKEPWEEKKVLAEIKKCSGKDFDPEVVEAFFACLDIIKSIAKRYPD